MGNPESKPNPAVQECLEAYWRRNIQILSVLLVIWAALGLGCGILFADVLNQWKIIGYPLGFWFAQQGSIIGFVLIILTYCLMMNRLDATHMEELERLDPERVKRVREAEAKASEAAEGAES